MDYIYRYDSPLGAMTMASDGDALIGLWFNDQRFYGEILDARREEKRLPIFDATERWLDEYFAGRAPNWIPRITFRTTPFRRDVWKLLTTIAYGKTTTYGAIATSYNEFCGAGRASARAVGGAIGRNAIAIVVPCHRVLARNGALTGYAAGLDRKRALLELEGATFAGSTSARY